MRITLHVMWFYMCATRFDPVFRLIACIDNLLVGKGAQPWLKNKEYSDLWHFGTATYVFLLRCSYHLKLAIWKARFRQDFPRCQHSASLPAGSTTGETVSYLFITYHPVWCGSLFKQIQSWQWRNLFKTLELVCIALRWARLNGRFWACCRIQGRIIPHSRTFFCQCELMQSLSKSCLEMLHDVMDLLHIVNDTYLFDPSLFLTGVSACT